MAYSAVVVSESSVNIIRSSEKNGNVLLDSGRITENRVGREELTRAIATFRFGPFYGIRSVQQSREGIRLCIGEPRID